MIPGWVWVYLVGGGLLGAVQAEQRKLSIGWGACVVGIFALIWPLVMLWDLWVRFQNWRDPL
jgi:hypothetical protein